MKKSVLIKHYVKGISKNGSTFFTLAKLLRILTQNSNTAVPFSLANAFSISSLIHFLKKQQNMVCVQNFSVTSSDSQSTSFYSDLHISSRKIQKLKKFPVHALVLYNFKFRLTPIDNDTHECNELFSFPKSKLTIKRS